jgi:hypothetical protein
MEPQDFESGNCYTVFFEKQIPIEFKFLESKSDGKIICVKRNGEIFDLAHLDQFISIKNLYPGW